MTPKQKKLLIRIGITLVVFAALLVLRYTGLFERTGLPFLEPVLCLIPYLLIGYDVLIKAVKNIGHGQVFNENFLMTVATAAAFCVGEYTEAVAVMLFYQVGMFFQNYAVERSRRSIADLMDICPEYANIESDGGIVQVDPDDVEIGTEIIIKPGERIPLDGIVTEGESLIDTAALTGEPVPRRAFAGSEIISGCVNGSGTLKARVTKRFEDSTVTRILELVENASAKKARTENIITRFAKIYTPAVTACALLLAVLPPLILGGGWGEWIERACIFLVISCPCALVISVPLGFFGGIGAASRSGILVKGGNDLESVAELTAVVFDKTGTLTKGEFKVSDVVPEGIGKEDLLALAALGESYSNHPIALSIREASGKDLPADALSEVSEIPGFGIEAVLKGSPLLIGSGKLMEEKGIAYTVCQRPGTVVYVALGGVFAGAVVISDTIKPEAREAVSKLKDLGIGRSVMLTGDRKEAAELAAEEIGIKEVYAELLPGGKVERVEELLREKGKLAFVGDGLNDAPVLTRADIGIAMGSLGSDAAIEAADVVIMDDDLNKIPAAVRIARRTLRIVRENIIFALGVKALIMILGAFGIATMWMAVFGDVGVAILAILNSMRLLRKNRAGD